MGGFELDLLYFKVDYETMQCFLDECFGVTYELQSQQSSCIVFHRSNDVPVRYL